MPKAFKKQLNGEEQVFFTFQMTKEMSDKIDEITNELKISKRAFMLAAIKDKFDKGNFSSMTEESLPNYALKNDVEELKKKVEENSEQIAYMRKMVDALFLKTDFIK